MQVAIMETDKKTYKNLKDLPGLNPTEVLDNMPICGVDGAYFIELERAQSIRSTISRLETDKSYRTQKHEGGVIIWREA
ncbi:hypothetical protein [Mucilaginibacter sp. 10I4]|uniref:hypothetical protein n=1 Tax=Mucilaginibacter sp. 10I4 TaxID=3048580 RepID=UPI002B23A90E|nr:hypothetical protein [Mucilaginibacter sp. 10I4]MEB0262868.1 hypothetical protein [Mucilaginibacter sp. 10I4]